MGFANNAKKIAKDRKPTGMRSDGVAAQRLFCREHGLPCFVPSGGVCLSCGGDIFGGGGYDLRRAGSELITSCPRCHATYCD